MPFHHIPWTWILGGIVKFLKAFGLIPGAVAAFGVRRLYQRRRQRKAMEEWPSTDATVLSGKVHKERRRSIWAEITYSYYFGEYRSGQYVRQFRREEDADEFIRQLREKRVHVRYDPAKPERSVILDRDMELIALLAPQVE